MRIEYTVWNLSVSIAMWLVGLCLLLLHTHTHTGHWLLSDVSASAWCSCIFSSILSYDGSFSNADASRLAANSCSSAFFRRSIFRRICLMHSIQKYALRSTLYRSDMRSYSSSFSSLNRKLCLSFLHNVQMMGRRVPIWSGWWLMVMVVLLAWLHSRKTIIKCR